PARHTKTRNIVFHICTGSNESLCMMKTEISNNGTAPVEARPRERHFPAVIQDHTRNGSARVDEASNRSSENKKRSQFQRPIVIIATAALAIAGIGYGALVM